MFFIFILLAIFILLLMITIHELGHYIAAKILKFKVNEFSIGFGPALFSRKTKSGEIFSLRMIPLGGYCAFESEDEDGKESEKSFYKEKPWKRIVVLLSGAAFNIVSAVMFSFIFILALGYASPNSVRVGDVRVNANNVAYNQLLQDDIITHINGVALSFDTENANTIGSITQGMPAGEVAQFTIIRNRQEMVIPLIKTWVRGQRYDGFGFTYRMGSIGAYEGAVVGSVAERYGGGVWNDFETHDVIKAVFIDGVEHAVTDRNSPTSLLEGVRMGQDVTFRLVRIQLREATSEILSSEDKDVVATKMIIEPAFLGFGFTQSTHFIRPNVGRAMLDSVPFTGRMSWAILGSFGRLFTGGTAITDMTGPVGTITQIGQITQSDWRNILILLPLLASNLAIFNLIPFPALDGGKIVFTVIEWIRGKPIPRNIENMIHLIGFAVLMLFVLALDIFGFFGRGTSALSGRI